MLDLTKINRDYQLKWFDGQVLHLPLPTQKTLVKIMNLEEIGDVEKQIEGLTAIIKEVLTNNRDNRKFSEEDFAELDLYTIQVIMEDYIDYVYRQLGE